MDIPQKSQSESDHHRIRPSGNTMGSKPIEIISSSIGQAQAANLQPQTLPSKERVNKEQIYFVSLCLTFFLIGWCMCVSPVMLNSASVYSNAITIVEEALDRLYPKCKTTMM